MKKILALCVVGLVALSMVGCTDNQRAKTFGGTTKIELPKGKKLVNATWKNNNLWYVVRDAKSGETPEVVEFVEASNFGIVEGKIIFIEKEVIL